MLTQAALSPFRPPQGVAHLCQMLRYTATLNTLRVDVASRDCAETVARELPNNRSLMHLTIGGPVPEQVWGVGSRAGVG